MPEFEITVIRQTVSYAKVVLVAESPEEAILLAKDMAPSLPYTDEKSKYEPLQPLLHVAGKGAPEDQE